MYLGKFLWIYCLQGKVLLNFLFVHTKTKNFYEVILDDDFTCYLVGIFTRFCWIFQLFHSNNFCLTSSVLLESILSPNLECIERSFWHNCKLFNWALSYFVWTDLVVQTSFDVLHLPKFILYVGTTIIFVALNVLQSAKMHFWPG